MNDITSVVTGEIVMAPAEEINYEYRLGMEELQGSLGHFVKCGQLLLDQKGKIEHGDWIPWCRENVEFSLTHAERFMKLAANSTRVLNLPTGTSMREAYHLLQEPKETKPAPPPAPKVTAFSWMHEPHVEAMMDGMKVIGDGVSVLYDNLKRAPEEQRDPDTSRYLLKMALISALKTAHSILVRLDIEAELRQSIFDYLEAQKYELKRKDI